MTIIHASGVCLVTEESSDNFVERGWRTVNPKFTFARAYVFGREIALSAAECAVLKLLMSNPGVYISRDKILDCLHDEGVLNERSVDTLIYRLRKKLFPKKLLARVLFIQTKYNKGYRVPRR